MSRMVSEVDQAVSRTLRDSLERLQRITEDLHQAVSDVAAACASARPSNTLPPLLRAQAQAASLAATLDVLARFVTTTLPQEQRFAIQADVIPVRSAETGAEPLLTPEPPSGLPDPTAEANAGETAAEPAASEMEGAGHAAEPVAALQPAAPFDIATLSVEDQELHRRASRVAKVSMQDIKLLHPNEVRLGKENKDLCLRLRDDIEKAHKEYDRRFQNILMHPVDYFYDWMVEILGEGDPEALGEYPYPSPAARR